MSIDAPILCFETLDSTNNKLKELEAQGAAHGTVVFASQQTAGRGRLGRQFLSPVGNMHFSILLRVDCCPQELMHLTCWAAVMTVKAIEAQTGLTGEPKIKWVNDIILRGKKVGGILTELILNGDKVRAVIIGVGVNCKVTPEEVAYKATDIMSAVQRSCTPYSLAQQLAHIMRTENFMEFPEEYRKRCVTLGKSVVCLADDATGTAMDVTDRGELVVQLDNGATRHVNSGEVEILGAY